MSARSNAAIAIEEYMKAGSHAIDVVDSIIEAMREAITIEKEACAKEPPLIQGYTAEQWQEIIDGGYLCEFSFGLIGLLESYNVHNGLFTEKNRDAAWTECRPAQIKGVMRPIFVKPVDDGVMCCFFNKDGYPINKEGTKLSYAFMCEDEIKERATSYIEL